MITTLWARFLDGRKNLKGVSEKTLENYGCAWKVWGGLLPEDPAQIRQHTIGELIATLRQQHTLCAISVNVYLKVLKAFLRWLAAEEYIEKPLKVTFLIQPKLVPSTYTHDQLRAILGLRPTLMSEQRVHLIAMLYLDTGARAQEILGLRRSDVDLDDCLLHLDGKGRRQRTVPFSRELRADLYRWMQRRPTDLQEAWLFPTGPGHHLVYENALRDFRKLQEQLGIHGRRLSFHAFRHTMATNFIRQGGDVFRLQRILGHSSLTMTQRYVHLQTADLAEEHQRLSLVSTLRRRQR